MDRRYFLVETIVPTTTKYMDIYGQSFQYDPTTKKVLMLNGSVLFTNLYGEKIYFTRDELSKYNIQKGTLVRVNKDDTITKLADNSRIRKRFNGAYEEKFGRGY
jgi:hypothetical protein